MLQWKVNLFIIKTLGAESSLKTLAPLTNGKPTSTGTSITYSLQNTLNYKLKLQAVNKLLEPIFPERKNLQDWALLFLMLHNWRLLHPRLAHNRAGQGAHSCWRAVRRQTEPPWNKQQWCNLLHKIHLKYHSINTRHPANQIAAQCCNFQVPVEHPSMRSMLDTGAGLRALFRTRQV